MKIKVNNLEYELVNNYKNVFNLDELLLKCTDYFNDFDYILGDYSYDKLRLKGFCDGQNKNFKNINDYKLIDEYLKNYCSYDCGYYILKKIPQKK